jgi:hypothetical protein
VQDQSEFDVVVSDGESIRDDKGNVVGKQLKISVRAKKSKDVKDQSATPPRVLTEVVQFASDLPGPAKVLSGLIKINFDAVGRSH